MPKVPTLQGNRVQTQALNVPRVSQQTPDLAAFGGGDSVSGISRAANRLNDTVNRIEQEAQKKADQIAILEADQKLSALETEMLYSNETGAMNSKGKDSFDLPNKVLPEFKKRAAEIESSLNSDFQKLSFRKMMADRSNHINRQIERHVSREAQRYDEQVTKSYVANEMNAAIESFHDPERIQLSIDRQRGALMSYADRVGMDAETRKNLVLETQSKTHSAVVNKLLNGGGDIEAQQYFKRNKDMITGEDRIRVEKALKQGKLMIDSQQASDEIYAKHSKDMPMALSKARDIRDPKKRDETLRRLRSQFAEAKAARVEEERVAFQTAYEAIENNQTMDSVPKEILANISLKDKKALEKRVAQLKQGLAVQSDIDTYYDLETMAGNASTRQEFMRKDLLKVKHLLSESDFKKFAKLQTDLRSGKGGREADGIETKNSIIKNALAAADIDTGRRASPEDLKRGNEFRRQVDKIAIEYEQANGRKIPNDELRKAVDNLMVEAVVDDGFFGFFKSRKRVFELSNQDTALVQFEDIPKSEIEEIRSALRDINVPTSNENILKLYTERLNLSGDFGG